MRYMLRDYVQVAGSYELSMEERAHWLGAYRAYVEAVSKAGELESS